MSEDWKVDLKVYGHVLAVAVVAGLTIAIIWRPQYLQFYLGAPIGLWSSIIIAGMGVLFWALIDLGNRERSLWYRLTVPLMCGAIVGYTDYFKPELLSPESISYKLIFAFAVAFFIYVTRDPENRISVGDSVVLALVIFGVAVLAHG